MFCIIHVLGKFFMNKTIMMMIVCLVAFSQTQGMEEKELNGDLVQRVSAMCSIPTQEEYEASFNTSQQTKEKETNTKQDELTQKIASTFDLLKEVQQKFKRNDERLENFEKQVEMYRFLNAIASTMENLEKKNIIEKTGVKGNIPVFSKNVSCSEKHSKLLADPQWKKFHSGCIIQSDSPGLHFVLWYNNQSLVHKHTNEQEIKEFSIKTDKKPLNVTLLPMEEMAVFIDKQNQFYIESKENQTGLLFPIEGIEIIQDTDTQEEDIAEAPEITNTKPIFTKNVSIANKSSAQSTKDQWREHYEHCAITLKPSGVTLALWWPHFQPWYRHKDEQEVNDFSIKTGDSLLNISLHIPNIIIRINKQKQFYVELKDTRPNIIIPIEGIEVIENNTPTTTETSS